MRKYLPVSKSAALAGVRKQRNNVESVIQEVNAVLGNPIKLAQHRCSPNVGHFYYVQGTVRLSASEVWELDRLFRDAKWDDVQVVVYKDTWCISLAADHSRNWRPVIDGSTL